MTDGVGTTVHNVHTITNTTTMNGHYKVTRAVFKDVTSFKDVIKSVDNKAVVASKHNLSISTVNRILRAKGKYSKYKNTLKETNTYQSPKKVAMKTDAILEILKEKGKPFPPKVTPYSEVPDISVQDVLFHLDGVKKDIIYANNAMVHSFEESLRREILSLETDIHNLVIDMKKPSKKWWQR